MKRPKSRSRTEHHDDADRDLLDLTKLSTNADHATTAMLEKRMENPTMQALVEEGIIAPGIPGISSADDICAAT